MSEKFSSETKNSKQLNKSKIEQLIEKNAQTFRVTKQYIRVKDTFKTWLNVYNNQIFILLHSYYKKKRILYFMLFKWH